MKTAWSSEMERRCCSHRIKTTPTTGHNTAKEHDLNTFTWLHWLMRYPCHTEATDMKTQSREGVQLSIVYRVRLDREHASKKKIAVADTRQNPLQHVHKLSVRLMPQIKQQWMKWQKTSTISLKTSSFLLHWQVPTERHFTVLHPTQKAEDVICFKKPEHNHILVQTGRE